MKKYKIYFLLLIAFNMAIMMNASSQTTSIPALDADELEDDAALPPDDDDPVDTPIDGGLTLLLAAGAGYGVKKYRDGRKKK